MEKHPEPKPWLILALVCLPIFIGALDLTIISAVLPEVIANLKVPIQEGLDLATWVVSGYLLAYAVSMTFMGQVSDIWGRRFVFLFCLGIFFVGSWLVATSQGWPAHIAFRLTKMVVGDGADKGVAGLYALIFSRVIQAFGAGAMVPVGMALVADIFPAKKRALPLGVIGAVDTAGWVLGHLYGGIMVQWFKWPMLFWFNLPMVGIVFPLIWWVMRGLKNVRHVQRVDWFGAVLISLALVGLNVSLGSEESNRVELTPGASNSHHHLIAFVLAVIAFAGFLWWEKRKPEPLLNLRIFANRNISAATAMNLLVGFCLYVGLVSVPLFINVVGAKDLRQGALVTGILLCMFTIPLAFASIPGGWLSDKIGYRGTTLTGLVIALAGFGMMLMWKKEDAPRAIDFVYALTGGGGPSSEQIGGLLHMIPGLLAAGVGIGLTISPIGTAVINAAAPAERGMASSLVIILRLIGMSISASTMTTYGLHRKTELGRLILKPEEAFDLERTAQVALEVVTKITGEMALIALVVCAVAMIPAMVMLRGDIHPATDGDE